MQVLTMSIAAVASAFMMPLSNGQFINNFDVASSDPKPAVVNSRPAATQASAVTAPVVPAPPAAEPPAIISVQPGDYLAKIASANNTSSERLFYANTEIINPDLIYPNQQLRVPKADEVLVERAIPQNQQTSAAKPVPSQRTTVQRQAVTVSAPVVADGSVWDRLAACESGGNWAINTGNGYYGGLQFSLSSWRGVGGSGYPNEASRDEQIARGEMLRSRGGWENWPACSAKLGLR